MRAIIFLAIVGVAFGNLCKKHDISDDDIRAAFSHARLGATTIFGASCPTFDIDAVAFSGKCKKLVKQATCYGLNAASHYDVGTVSYGHLAADVSNVEHLGNLACEKAEGCFGQVKAAMESCLAANPNFVQETINAAEKAYKDNFEEQVKAFAKGNKGSLLGDLTQMAMNRFSSADDIQAFINEHLTEGVKADAQAAADQAQALAEEWCEVGCTSQTATFLRGIFGHMNGGGCSDASEFCGQCQDRAASYFTRNQLPCCIEKVVQKGIEAYDYVVDNYSDALEAYRDEISGGLSDTAIAEATAIKDEVVRQFGCVQDVYSANKPDCTTA